MTLRYGIIGAGMMGQEHIRNLALIDGVKVVGIADPDDGMRDQAKNLAREYRVAGQSALPNCYSDYRSLLADDICDVYVVASPNDTHATVMLDVMATSAAILCEKPLCTTVADCERLIDVADTREGGPVWVAMEYRYMPPVAKLIDEVSSGTVGSVHMMSIREHRFPFLTKVGDWNRFNIRTGGTLTEKCCHFWDLMRLIAGSDPVRVFASGGADVNHRDESYEGKTPDIIDNAYVIVEFASGVRGMLDLCMFAEGSYWQESIAVTGPKARVEAMVPGPARLSADKVERSSQLVIADRQTKTETIRVIEEDPLILKAGDHHGSTYYQHRRFFDLLQSGYGAPEVSLVDGLWSVRVGEAAEQSARSGEPVVLVSS